MDAKHLKTKRWTPGARTFSRLNVSLLAAEFTDIAYRIALNRGLEKNWLEFQLNLWRTTTQKLDRASKRRISRIHEGPTTVGRKSVPTVSRPACTFSNPERENSLSEIVASRDDPEWFSQSLTE